MRSFSYLSIVVALTLGLTLSLDLLQRRVEDRRKETIVFASMWAIGEPMQQAYAEVFRRFEAKYPKYRVRPRWDGRWVVPAIRPRLLTRSDPPDIVNSSQSSLRILVAEGYAERLDGWLEQAPHPDTPGKSLRQAFTPKLLRRAIERPHPGKTPRFEPGVYVLPGGLWLHLVFYNQHHYRRLGLRIPRTWAELLSNCSRLAAAGITPFTANGYAYAEYWPEVMLPLTLGYRALFRSISQGTPRFDKDPRYRAIFAVLRKLHQPAWFSPGWRGAPWPSAQRSWARGAATHMINGSWLLREMLTYRIDWQKLKVGAFAVPALQPPPPTQPNTRPRPRAIFAEIAGYTLLKDSRRKDAAKQLLRFLSRSDSATYLAERAVEIPAVSSADYPAPLRELKAELEGVEFLYTESTQTRTPKWNKFVFHELFRPFLMAASEDASDYLSLDVFLTKLQRMSERYRQAGGEASID